MKQTRNTVQRQIILNAVLDDNNHPCADDIYDKVRGLNPHISRGTVYRNLNLLSEMGRIKRLSMPTGPDRYDWRMENHYHFLCRGCGKVIDAIMKYNDELNSISPGLEGYKTEWHRLVLVGLCADCNSAE